MKAKAPPNSFKETHKCKIRASKKEFNEKIQKFPREMHQKQCKASLLSLEALYQWWRRKNREKEVGGIKGQKKKESTSQKDKN